VKCDRRKVYPAGYRPIENPVPSEGYVRQRCIGGLRDTFDTSRALQDERGEKEEAQNKNKGC